MTAKTGRKERDDSSVPEERVRKLTISGARVYLLGTIKGLLSERQIVETMFEESKPKAVAVHIGKEEIKGLRAVVDGKVETTYLSSYEKVYAKKLSKFGEVQIPPPSLVRGMELSRESDIPILPLDYNDEEYASTYAHEVSGLTMIRQSLRLKRVNRKKFKSERSEDFVLEWDRISNRLRGHRKLEMKREEHMAGRIRKISKKYDVLLCILELERLEGVYERLK
ncbi:MAG: hypothetical protein ACMUIG_03505 [Thermoplasmatota archaeon]